jgi:hypothetical protein
MFKVICGTWAAGLGIFFLAVAFTPRPIPITPATPIGTPSPIVVPRPAVASQPKEVHVRAHTRVDDGKTIFVPAYTRSRPKD